MKLTVTVIAIVLLVLGIVIFGPDKTAGPAPVLRIATSNTPLSAPLIIAQEKGYFAGKGLNIKLILAHGGVNCMNMLLKGEADLATTSGSVVMFSRFERQDFGVIASFAESDNDVKIMALAQRQALPLSAVENSRVGVVQNSASEFFVDAYLKMEGLDTQHLQKVTYQPQQLGDALFNQEVDYISVWEPYGYTLSRDYPDRVFHFDTQGINNLHFLLVHRNDEQGNMTIPGEMADRLLDALVLANQFIHREPELAREIVANFLDLPEAQLTSLWPDYTFRLSLSDAMYLSLTMQANWAMGSGKVSQDVMPDYRELFVHSPLLPSASLLQSSP